MNADVNRYRRALCTAVALASMATGCSVTQKAPVVNPGTCAMIPPSTCAYLAPGTSEQMGLRYINPNVQWSQYTRVMINPVAFYGPEASKMSAADQQALTNYFYTALVQKIGAKFPIVDEPGPGVIKLQFAMVDASGATPVLRTVSMIVPQARVLGSLKYLATDSYPFVGGAQAEMLATDSVTGNVLAAAVDHRIGGGAVSTAAQWQWGDAENAMDHWAEVVANKLASIQSGQPPS
jgi:hypothetical protein